MFHCLQVISSYGVSIFVSHVFPSKTLPEFDVENPNFDDKVYLHERKRNYSHLMILMNFCRLNDDIKGEYQNQMSLFQQLREKYNEKIVLLNKENENLKSELQNLKEENNVTN